jgi:hypothetical protein
MLVSCLTLRTCRWRRYVPPKRRTLMKLHGIRKQRIIIYVSFTLRNHVSQHPVVPLQSPDSIKPADEPLTVAEFRIRLSFLSTT